MYELIRSSRRTISIEIKDDARVLVRAPRFASREEISGFVGRKQGWINKHLDIIKAKSAEVRKREFAEGEEYLFLGQPRPLRVAHGGESALVFRDGEFTLSPDHRSRAKEFFASWYKEQARAIIGQRLGLYKSRLLQNPVTDILRPEGPKDPNTFRDPSASYRQSPGPVGPRMTDRTEFRNGLKSAFNSEDARVKITSAAKRWGSCSRKGGLSFSWRLAMAPLEVIDYVVIHELVHIGQMDHSKRFWQKVEAICPDYRTHKQWLHNNAHKLTL